MKSNFATLSPEGRRAMASMGGKAAHAAGTARKWTPEQAREAGRKGGLKVSQNREHMAALGRRGGRKFQSTEREIQAKLAGQRVIRAECEDSIAATDATEAT